MELTCGMVCTAPHLQRSVVHSSADPGRPQFSTHHASLDMLCPSALTHPLGSPPWLGVSVRVRVRVRVRFEGEGVGVRVRGLG